MKAWIKDWPQVPGIPGSLSEKRKIREFYRVPMLVHCPWLPL